MDKTDKLPFCNPCQAYHDSSTPCFDVATRPQHASQLLAQSQAYQDAARVETKLRSITSEHSRTLELMNWKLSASVAAPPPDSGDLRQKIRDLLANGNPASLLGKIAALVTTDKPLDKCEHGILWSMECLSCGPSEYVAATPSPVAATVETKAKEIADYLFTNGFGDKGDHLNLYRDGDVYLGGWNEDSVVRGIVSYLNDYTAQSAPSDSSTQSRHYFCSCGGALTAEEYIEHYFEKGHDRGEPELLIRAAAAEISSTFGLKFQEASLAQVAAIIAKHLGSAAGWEQEGKEQG